MFYPLPGGWELGVGVLVCHRYTRTSSWSTPYLTGGSWGWGYLYNTGSFCYTPEHPHGLPLTWRVGAGGGGTCMSQIVYVMHTRTSSWSTPYLAGVSWGWRYLYVTGTPEHPYGLSLTWPIEGKGVRALSSVKATNILMIHSLT